MQKQWRKRPIEITAEQFDPEKVPWPKDVESEEMENGSIEYSIMTLEGVARVQSGDFIVTGIEGERYPVNQDIFYDTYDLVGEGDDDKRGPGGGETRRNEDIRIEGTPAEMVLELSRRIGRGEILGMSFKATDTFGNFIIGDGGIKAAEDVPEPPPPLDRKWRDKHTSDCAVHNMPAYPAGKCDCGYVEPKEGLAQPDGVRMSGSVEGDGTVK